MPRKKLHHGVGAKCEVLTKFIHPSKHVRDKYINHDNSAMVNHQMEVLLVGVEDKIVRNKYQLCYTFRADNFPGILLYAVKKHVVVKEEGAVEHFFE